jgi:hypothetical protein
MIRRELFESTAPKSGFTCRDCLMIRAKASRISSRGGEGYGRGAAQEKGEK